MGRRFRRFIQIKEKKSAFIRVRLIRQPTSPAACWTIDPRVSATILDQPLHLDPSLLARALDPIAFVEFRTTLGGASPAATTAVLHTQAEAVQLDQKWLEDEKQKLAAASKRLQRQVENLSVISD